MHNKNLKFKMLLTSMLSSLILNAENLDILNIDNLLLDIENKTDLSAKTKLENGGISYIYTREDLQKMQAHNLKDILKSTYPFGYSENNFGISDPFAMQTSTPFMSSKIKIYIDNQEMSTGVYGSGLVIYGKMDIDFVDHIEVYAGNPTFEFSTEPAFTIIKLYSRVAQKDEGSKVNIGIGSYGTKEISGYTTSTLNNGWSYFAYASAIDKKRKKYTSYGSSLSKDKKNAHIFGTLSKDNHHLIIDAIDSNEDSFMAVSVFATPNKSTLKNNYLHIGYDTKFENLTFLLTFDKMDTKTAFEDMNTMSIKYVNSTYNKNIPYSFNTDVKSEVYTAGLNYDIKTESNKLVLGMKYRAKHFRFDTIHMNGVEFIRSGHSRQKTSTVFAENQYSFSENKIFTSGISYSQVRNNYSNQDDDLLGYRFGFTYTNDSLVSKTTASHIETSLDPYMVNSSYLNNPFSVVPIEEQDVFMQNFKYKKQSSEYEFIASYMRIKNKLLPNPLTGLLSAYNKDLKIVGGILRYTREYRTYDKLEVTLGMNRMRNLPMMNTMFQYSSIVRNFNTIGKFDIFNEVLYYRDNKDKRNYFDYTAGIIYHFTNDLSFSLKGINIFNKARPSNYMRVNPMTFKMDNPLKISPIDKQFILRMEYTF